MAQQSIVIDSAYLKHLRSKKRESQVQTAEGIHVSERQYQNIEKGRGTTTKVVKSIAKHFDVNEDQLFKPKTQDDSLWYVASPFENVGTISEGYYEAIFEIKKRAKQFSDIDNIRLTIETDDSLKKISLFYNNIKLYWTMRPVELNEKIGFTWTKFTQWQQYNWEETIQSLKYGCITDVLIDGNPIVPKGRIPQFMVQFHRVQNSESTYIGYRLFSNNAQLRVSLSKWLDSSTGYNLTPDLGIARLSFTYEFGRHSSKSFSISKVWVDEEGKQHKAPWPSKEIDKVSKAITETDNGKRKWAIPIGLGEPFEEDSIPEISPDVFVDRTEIIKIPKFTYHSKRSD
jgi:transcriptional regulator with XRE-family HTH domain